MNQRGFIALPALSPLGWVLVGMGVLCAALTAWALLERTFRLDCKVELVTARAQAKVLSDALERQNAGVDALDKTGKAIIAEARRTLTAIRAEGRKRDPELAEIKAILANPTPTGADCGRAWREIEGRARP
ncbi:MAG TPA: hypothetical protein VJ797_15780 [Burkholderiales bacterium]|nr:hypothetical protein [Burkholderiales bacterium]